MKICQLHQELSRQQNSEIVNYMVMRGYFPFCTEQPSWMVTTPNPNKGKSTPSRRKGCLRLGKVKLSKQPPSGHFLKSVPGIHIHLQFVAISMTLCSFDMASNLKMMRKIVKKSSLYLQDFYADRLQLQNRYLRSSTHTSELSCRVL